MSTEKVEIVRMADALSSALEDPAASFDLLLAKAYRLAEATGSMEHMTWLTYELHGYDSSTPIGEKYARLTARWDGSSEKGYFGSATSIASSVESMAHTLEVHKQFQPSGQYAQMQQNEKASQVNSWATAIAPMKKV